MTEELGTRSYGPWVIAIVVVGLGILLYVWSRPATVVPTDVQALRDRVGTNEPSTTDVEALRDRVGTDQPSTTDVQSLRDRMNQ